MKEAERLRLQITIEKAMDMLEKFAQSNGLELEGLVAFTFPDETVQVETLQFYPQQDGPCQTES